MKAWSLFSGVGGFELAFERVGIETVLQVESDPYCLKVLNRHWPNTAKLCEVKDVRGEEGVDLIYGGFPCQDLSTAGRRAGLKGDRSGLWFEFARILREVRPRWAVIENVPGLLSSNQGRDLGIVAETLEELFPGSWGGAVLDAQFFGVAQRRRRLFLVGGPTRGSVASVLSLCESCGGNTGEGREEGQEAPGAIAVRLAQTGSNGWGIGVDGRAYSLDGTQQGVYAPDHAATLRGRSRQSGSTLGRGGEDDDNPVVEWAPEVAHTLRSEGADASEDGTNRGTPLVVSSRWAPNVAKPIASHHRRDDLDTDTYVVDVAQITSKANRSNPRPGDPAPTLNQKGQLYVTAVKPGFTDPVSQTLGSRDYKGAGNYWNGSVQGHQVVSGQVRRLTPIECERLQGWPDDWTRWAADGTEISNTQRYRMIGNGVAAPVAEWIGRRIMGMETLLD